MNAVNTVVLSSEFTKYWGKSADKNHQEFESRLPNCSKPGMTRYDKATLVYKFSNSDVTEFDAITGRHTLICYDKINPTHYIFHDDTETCTPVYTEYFEDYKKFYEGAKCDIEKAKKTREYGLDAANHPNWFDASYISWLSYDSLNIELPDGYLYFAPIINWGRYREENGKFVMPITVRLNHAIADGYLIAKVFKLLEEEIKSFR